MEFIKGDNNAKGDAGINKKIKLTPLEHVFDTDSETVCNESEDDEEMDTHETTVIENVENGRSSPATV